MEFANRLITARKAKGLSQEALAEALSLSRQAISKWETGESRPDLDNLIGLCRELDITVEYLCFGTESAVLPENKPCRCRLWKRILCLISVLLLTVFAFFLGKYWEATNADPIPTIPNSALSAVYVVDATVHMQGDANIRILLNSMPDNLSADLLVLNSSEAEPVRLPCQPDAPYFCAVLQDPLPNTGYHISIALKMADEEVVLPLMGVTFDSINDTCMVNPEWSGK